MDIKLSEHFQLYEFTASQVATRHNIDNTPSDEVIDNLILLCTNVLERIREEFGPVRITSGYRCPKLNKKVGGSLNSQHMKGEAADIIVPNVKPYDVSKWISIHPPYDQVILEFNRWTHVSYMKKHNRTKALTAMNTTKTGGVRYSEGIIS